MVGEALARGILGAIEALEAARIPYAVFGGLAVNAWGRLRDTLDGDVIVFCKVDEFQALTERFRAAGLSHHDGSDRFRVGDIEVRRFWYPVRNLGVSVKIDVVRSDSPYYRELSGRRVEAGMLGRRLWTVSREDLVLLKLCAGRPIDQVDARELMRLHLEALDREYLSRWAGELGVRPALDQCLREAAQAEPPF